LADLADSGTSRRRNRTDSGIEGEVSAECDDQFVVRSLARGLRVLSHFSVDNPEWSLASLARASGLHKATTYRVTRTMEAEGFLIFDPSTGNYHVGPSVIPLSYLATGYSEFEKMARPFLEKLAAETGETANLGVESEGSFVIIGSVLTSQTFKPSLPVGRVLADLSNSHGKLLVALKSPEERSRYLARKQPRLTQYSLVSRSEIEAELDRAAKEGVAYDLEEQGLGVCSVSAPVLGQNGAVLAALSVVAPKERFGPEDRQRATDIVKRVAAEFSAFLGYSAK
jgi:DNA-binding IclR family transcriptional regulator